jgi:hypothetical protein
MSMIAKKQALIV